MRFLGTYTDDRVMAMTPPRVRRRLERRTRDALRCAALEGSDEIDRRLALLREEWDVDRALFAWAPAPLVVGVGLAAWRGRPFLVLPAVVATFLATYAVLGWCPPSAALRRFGFRTHREIERERTALKALRGDFAHLAGIDQLLAHVEA